MPNKAEFLAGLIDANGDVLADNLDNVSVAFADVTSKPTTLAGYGITDAASDTELSTAVANSANWDTAYGWGDHSTQGYATTTYVDTSVSNLVASAPATLDTLNELAAALGDDANFSTTVTNSIATKAPLASPAFTGDATFDTNTLAIDSTNNRVGVGTASPAQPLDVNGTIKLNNTIISPGNFNFDCDTDNLGGRAYKFKYNGTEVVRIDSSGKVGIGTDSPQTALHVYSSPAEGMRLEGNDEYIFMRFRGTVSATGTNLGLLGFANLTGSATDLSLSNDQNGNITFHTNGSEGMRLEADRDLHVDGDVIAYSTTISDERLKTNIQGIENAVAKVSQLNGYTFEYKADGKVSAGVIAQEVEAVLPEAVSEKQLPLKADDDQEYKVVNYDALHGLLIEAVKELAARVEALEAK